MKKLVKGIMAMSLSVALFGGCSCQKNEPPVIQEQEETPVALDYSNNYKELYQEVLPSVVRVHAGGRVGTGVVYKEEGEFAYILTNAHVLTDKDGTRYYDNLEVVFSNYTRVKGTFVFLDKNEDVGVISVKKSDNYELAKIIDNDSDVEIGESVFSVGHPNYDYFSMTMGNITANRIETSTAHISNAATTTFVYNSTATVNSGNSGGPMFNSKGEVIAINTMHPKEETGLRNYNYSIPINHFIKVANYIVVNRENYVRPTLGIGVKSICDYTTNEIATMGIAVKKGVYVTQTNDASIQKGRIITHINGKEIATEADYKFELLKYSKNQTITLTTIDVVGVQARDVNITVR